MTQLPKVPKPTHATYIEERSPKWKYHTDLGKAKNAASYMARDCQIYKVLDNGELELLWEITKDMHDYRNGSPRMPWKNEKDELIKAKKESLRANKLYLEQATQRIERLMADRTRLKEELEKLENDGN